MNIEDVRIVKLKPKEWKKYKNIRLEALKLEPKAFSLTYKECFMHPDQRWKEELSSNNEIYLFAESDGKIIGMAKVTFKEEGAAENTAVIHGTYINNFYRGRGVGKRLIDELLKEIEKNKDIKKIKLWVKEAQIPARRIYESMGFSFTERAGEHTLIMEKVLDQDA